MAKRALAAIFALCCCAPVFTARGSAQQSATPAPTPAVTPSPAYRFVFVPSPAPDDENSDGPRIREIDLTDSVLAAPGELHVRVLTSAAVVSVTAGTLGRDISIPPRRPGVFAFDGYIPNVPDYARNRPFDVDFVASAADGRASTVTLSLSLK